MAELQEILKERGADYGPVEKQFSVAMHLKRTFQDMLALRVRELAADNGGQSEIKQVDIDVMIEALHMIGTKMSRLFTGDPTKVDTWDDIAGYAKLVANYLDERETHMEQAEKAKAKGRTQ